VKGNGREKAPRGSIRETFAPLAAAVGENLASSPRFQAGAKAALAGAANFGWSVSRLHGVVKFLKGREETPVNGKVNRGFWGKKIMPFMVSGGMRKGY
jgi:hypothetical protein